MLFLSIDSQCIAIILNYYLILYLLIFIALSLFPNDLSIAETSAIHLQTFWFILRDRIMIAQGKIIIHFKLLHASTTRITSFFKYKLSIFFNSDTHTAKHYIVKLFHFYKRRMQKLLQFFRSYIWFICCCLSIIINFINMSHE